MPELELAAGRQLVAVPDKPVVVVADEPAVVADKPVVVDRPAAAAALARSWQARSDKALVALAALFSAQQVEQMMSATARTATVPTVVGTPRR